MSDLTVALHFGRVNRGALSLLDKPVDLVEHSECLSIPAHSADDLN
jgi:hypothetical protein